MESQPMTSSTTMTPSNIILIGMPGSGKSTVGVILAKMTSRDFLDTDLLIQLAEKRSLQDIIDQDGHMALRAIEERELVNIHCMNHIIATGGSAAYSAPAMKHLKSIGTIIFLHADLPTLRSRIHNFNTRGLAKRPDQSFEDLFTERFTLYRTYADIIIESSGYTQEEVCGEIVRRVCD